MRKKDREITDFNEIVEHDYRNGLYFMYGMRKGMS